MPTYKDKNTGEQVTIIKEDDSFYTLDNKVRVKKETFEKRYESVGTINPDDFFNPTSAIEKLAKQLQNMDTNQIQERPDDVTRIKYKPPVVISDSQHHISPVSDNKVEGPSVNESQRQRMIEEYKKNNPASQQPQKFVYVDDDGAVEYEMPKVGDITQQPQAIPQQPLQTFVQPEAPKADPMQMMFKMFKNNYDVTINLKFEDKIANPQFIAMVMENVEGDAIEYYSKIILDKILKEPLKLKKEIYDQLKREVYGAEQIEPEKEEPKK